VPRGQEETGLRSAAPMLGGSGCGCKRGRLATVDDDRDRNVSSLRLRRGRPGQDAREEHLERRLQAHQHVETQTRRRTHRAQRRQWFREERIDARELSLLHDKLLGSAENLSAAISWVSHFDRKRGSAHLRAQLQDYGALRLRTAEARLSTLRLRGEHALVVALWIPVPERRASVGSSGAQRRRRTCLASGKRPHG
jgi:hypothetical protein